VFGACFWSWWWPRPAARSVRLRGRVLVLTGTFTAGKDWRNWGWRLHVRPSPLLAGLAAVAVILAACVSADYVPAGDVRAARQAENRDPQVRDLGLRERLVLGVLVLTALVHGQGFPAHTRRTAASCRSDGKLSRPGLPRRAQIQLAGPACARAAAGAANASTGRTARPSDDRPMRFQISALGPAAVDFGRGGLALLLDHVQERTPRSRFAVALLGCLASFGKYSGAMDEELVPPTHLRDVGLDRTAHFLDAVLILPALVTCCVGAFMREHDFAQGEHYALVLFATAGMMTVVHATHLLSLLIGIETMSLPPICGGELAAAVAGAEGALKYLLLGAFAAGFLVYGTALVYGTTGGEMSYAGIAARAGRAAGNPLFPSSVCIPY